MEVTVLENTKILIIYLVAINVVTFFVYGLDKLKAKRRAWRIPEAVLLTLAVIGGSVGAWLGMKVWHHKTAHNEFRFGIPLIIAAQIALFFLVSCGTKQEVVETPIPVHGGEYVPEHSESVFLVMYDAEIGKAPLQKAIEDYGCEIVYDYNIITGMALKKPEDKTLEETMEYFRKVEGVTSVEYDHIYHLTDPVKPKLEIR